MFFYTGAHETKLACRHEQRRRESNRDMLARSLLLIVSCEAAITKVTQKSYNTYEIVSSAVNDGITLVDSDGEPIATTRVGNTFTVTNPMHYNNVNAALQDGTSFSVASWHFQLAQTAACCRAAAVKSNDAASDYQKYTPRMTVDAGGQLTVEAKSRAPQLVYVKVTATSGAYSGVLLSADTSETFAGTGSYSRTVDLPNDFNIDISTLHACGLVSDGIESCTELTNGEYNSPTPPYPPSLPPSPPVSPLSPSQPPTPRKPPPSVMEEDSSVSPAVIGVVVGLLALLLILGIIGGVFVFRRMKGPKQRGLSHAETELKQGTTQSAV